MWDVQDKCHSLITAEKGNVHSSRSSVCNSSGVKPFHKTSSVFTSKQRDQTAPCVLIREKEFNKANKNVQKSLDDFQIRPVTNKQLYYILHMNISKNRNATAKLQIRVSNTIWVVWVSFFFLFLF